jgi:hypothetical protein
MAYASTITITSGSKGAIEVLIVETDVAAASEATIELNLQYGRLHRQVCALTSGAGSTVDPVAGIATAPALATATSITVNGTAASAVDNIQAGGVPFRLTDGNMYHRSVPDSGTDNAITTRYFITRGW